MRTHEFKTGVWLPVPPEKIFSFFSNAANLDVLTPSWLHFCIMTPQPVEMRAGALIDYRLRIHGLPMRWRTLIKEWRPPHRFVDEQLHGPYRQWIHEHIFEPVDDGTLARDIVHYSVPFDIIMHPLFVRPDIERIFAFRRQSLRTQFGVDK